MHGIPSVEYKKVSYFEFVRNYSVHSQKFILHVIIFPSIIQFKDLCNQEMYSYLSMTVAGMGSVFSGSSFLYTCWSNLFSF